MAINSLLQMALYAPFAILYINIVRSPSQRSENVAVSYSVVARSVAVFLGNSINIMPALISVCRYPSCWSGCHPPIPSQSHGAQTISTTFHRLDRPIFTHWLTIYDHHPLCLTRQKCRKSDCPSCTCRRSSHLLFRNHLRVYPVHLSKIQVRLQSHFCSKFHCRKQ